MAISALPIKPHSKGANKPQPQADNFLEAIRSVGQSSLNSFKTDLLKEGSKDVLGQFGQLFGLEKSKVKASGELLPGKTLELDRVFQEETEEKKKLKAKLAHERRLRDEDRAFTSEQTQKLQVQLKSLVIEVQKLAKSTKGLSQEVKIAAAQPPVEAGEYHVTFFESLVHFIKSFRKRIDNASVWMHSQNQRSIKMRMFWGQVGKSGAKRLLSSEDYMTRSAG